MSRGSAALTGTRQQRRRHTFAAHALEPRPVVELRVHPQHRGFTLGGRCGKIVVRVVGGPDSRVLVETDEALDARVLIKQGWKWLACNGTHRDDGMELLCALGDARRSCQDCILTFEVDADMAKALGKRVLHKQLARRELRDALGGRSLAALGDLQDAERKAFLRNLRIQWLMVDASAVFEVETLLGLKTGQAMQLSRELFVAAKRGDVQALRDLLNHPDYSLDLLLQRDGGGNVMLHHAANLECATLLTEAEPRAKQLLNARGHSPVHAYVLRQPEEAKALSLLADTDADLLRLDDNGISAAMVIQGPARASLEARLVPWSDFQAALELDQVTDILSRLLVLAPDGTWQGIFAFHCFGEQRVWQRGQHTTRSATRLIALSDALERLVVAIEAMVDHTSAAAAVVELLRASRGPRCPPLDPREPYRVRLISWMQRLQAKISASLEESFLAVQPSQLLQGDSASLWVKKLRSFVAEDVANDRCLSCFDYLQDLPCQGVRFRVEAPAWLHSDYDLGQVFADLQRVGSIDALCGGDGAYDMLRLAESQGEMVCALDEDDCFLARWYAAWLRGCCQTRYAETISEVKAALGHQSGAFYARQDVKSMERTFERLSEVFSQLLAALKKAGVREGAADARTLLRQAAASVADINACTYVAESLDDLHTAVCCLQDAAAAGRLRVRRLVNGFSSEALERQAQSWDLSRDICIWVEVTDGMVVEVRMQLQSLAEGEQLGQLPFDVRRGRYDWPHLAAGIEDQVRQLLEGDRERQRAQREAEEAERRRLEDEERRLLEAEEAERLRVEETIRLRVEEVRRQKADGASSASLMERGFKREEISACASLLKNEGLSRDRMEAAGFPLSELIFVGVEFEVCRVLFDYAFKDFRNAGIAESDLLAKGITADIRQDAQRLRTQRQDAAQ